MITRYRVVIIVLIVGLSLWNGLICWQRIDAVRSSGSALDAIAEAAFVLSARRAALFHATEIEVLILTFGIAALVVMGRRQPE